MRFLELELKYKVSDAKIVWIFKEKFLDVERSKKLFGHIWKKIS